MRIVLGSILYVLLGSCSHEKDKILPTQKSITESVYASITVQPDSLYEVFSSVQGILETNFVEEGDLIQKGAPIIQIKNTSSTLMTKNAGLSLTLSRKQYQGNTSILKSLITDIESAQLKLENDSINYERQRRLWDVNIGSKASYESRKLAFDLSKRNLEALKKKYNLTKQELEIQVKQAKNSYKNALENTEDFKIVSAISGSVYALYKNPGELINTQTPVALIGSDKTFIIEMLVDEVDIVKVATGKKAMVTLDAYQGELFTATVTKIYPKKDDRNQTFIVEALFDNPPAVLYPGLSGEANIVVNKQEKALVIPRAYLINGNQVKTEEGLVAITIGLENIDTVAITSGITPTTWIYKPN